MAYISRSTLFLANMHTTVYQEERLPSLLVHDLRHGFKEDVVVDGEFHSLTGDFYDFRSGVAKMDERLGLVIWDVLSIETDRPLHERKKWLEANMNQTDRFKMVPYQICQSKKEILDFFDSTVKQDYEGIVCKPDEGYHAKWLKIRSQDHVDAVILAVKKTEEWIRDHVPATFLVGCYDPEMKQFKAIGDISSGLKHHEKKAIGETVSTIKTGESKDYIYVSPIIVVEVA